MFILLLSLLPLLLTDVGEEFNSTIANSQIVFVGQHYFHKKTKFKCRSLSCVDRDLSRMIVYHTVDVL
jgi:hypothetical protein